MLEIIYISQGWLPAVANSSLCDLTKVYFLLCHSQMNGWKMTLFHAVI